MESRLRKALISSLTEERCSSSKSLRPVIVPPLSSDDQMSLTFASEDEGGVLRGDNKEDDEAAAEDVFATTRPFSIRPLTLVAAVLCQLAISLAFLFLKKALKLYNREKIKIEEH